MIIINIMWRKVIFLILWYFEPILSRSDSINMKGNQVFFVRLKWLRFHTKEYIREKLKLLYEFIIYLNLIIWVINCIHSHIQELAESLIQDLNDNNKYNVKKSHFSYIIIVLFWNHWWSVLSIGLLWAW